MAYDGPSYSMKDQTKKQTKVFEHKAMPKPKGPKPGKSAKAETKLQYVEKKQIERAKELEEERLKKAERERVAAEEREKEEKKKNDKKSKHEKFMEMHKDSLYLQIFNNFPLF